LPFPLFGADGLGYSEITSKTIKGAQVCPRHDFDWCCTFNDVKSPKSIKPTATRMINKNGFYSSFLFKLANARY
jgi:hypothetical protein